MSTSGSMLLAQETESLCVPQYDLFLIFFVCSISCWWLLSETVGSTWCTM